MSVILTLTAALVDVYVNEVYNVAFSLWLGSGLKAMLMCMRTF